MRFLGQRQDPVRLFGKRLMLLALLVLVCIAASSVWKVYKKERDSRTLRIDAEAQLADLQQRKTQLERDIEALKTPRTIEETLRMQYRLAKNGEGLIVIVDPPAATPVATSSGAKTWFSSAFSWW